MNINILKDELNAKKMYTANNLDMKKV